MKKLVSLVLVLVLVLPLLAPVLAEGDVLPVEEPVVTQEPAPEPEPAKEPVQEPAPEPEPTKEPVQESTQEPVPEPEAEATQEPVPEPEAEATQEPTQEPEQETEATQEPEAEATEEPVEEPKALPSPTNLRWDEEGNIFFDAAEPAPKEYRVTIYVDGKKTKEFLVNGDAMKPGEAIQTDGVGEASVLGEPGEYVFEVVALAIEGWLDSEPAVSPAFQYEPIDTYAGMDAITALVAMVANGDMTAQEARDAFMAMSAREIAALLLDNPAAHQAMAALEALYMQAEGIGLSVDVALLGAGLVGTGLNAWDSPQELHMSVEAAIDAEGTLTLSYGLEAIQPEPNPPKAYPGAAVSPLYVTLPLPADFTVESAALTSAGGEKVLFTLRDGQLCFVITALGEYRLTGWITPVEEPIPVFTMPLGGFTLVGDLMAPTGDLMADNGEVAPVGDSTPVGDLTADNGDEAQTSAAQDEPVAAPLLETDRLLELLAAPPAEGVEWSVPDASVGLLYNNGVFAAISVGETLVTRRAADGQEQQVIVRVLSLEGGDIETPYDRVLPSGAVKADRPLSITPAYGLSQLTAVRTSDVNGMNRADISFGLAHVSSTATVNPFLLTVIHKSAISGRVFEKIEMRNATTGQTIWQSGAQYYSGGSYSMTAVIPAFANGKYTLIFFAYPGSEPENSSIDVYDFAIDFYIENGRAYFTHEYSDSCNNGVLAMLNRGNVPDDVTGLISLGTDSAYSAASALIESQAKTLAATSGSQYGKAMAIYRWIAENIAFDYDALYNNTYHSNPYMTYIARRGTSSGYATLATLMLHYAGIKSVSVIGYGGPKVGVSVQNHQWNAVQIDKSWYFFDVTWDAVYSFENVTRIKTGSNTYKYFLPTTQFLSYDHRATGLGIASSGTGVTNNLRDLAPIEAFVKRLYVNVLGRQPDTVGFLNWRNGLANGQITGADACVGFFTSNEFVSRNLTNAQFLDILYRTCLNRKPGADPGFNDWMKTLAAGATRNSVLNGFIVSPEFNKLCQNAGIVRGTYVPTDYRDRNILVTMFVVRLYREFLGRDPYDPVWPDTQGLEDWCRGLLSAGLTGNQVAWGFYNSPEFQRRMVPGDPKYLTDVAFVTVLYRTLLGRDPDAAGLTGWVKSISTNGRKSVYDGFIASAEWKKLMGIYGIKDK